MSGDLQTAIDAILERAVPGVPGVVAVVTDRERDIYVGAAGVRSLAGEQAMTPDTVCAAFSTTKAITGTVCLQLVEGGELDLDAPAREYAPAIADLQVIEGFDDDDGGDGAPRLRAPRTELTTRMLLTHTAGLGYDFFDETYARLAAEHGQPSITTASRAALMTPLLFDPGERWNYGSSLDWAGQVVEGITGRRLGEEMTDRVLGPLGMTDTAFTLTPAMRERMATMHRRNADGSLTPTRYQLPSPPEIDMGGHGLFSTALDYTRFIRMWLNDGVGPDGREILRPETVAMAAANHLGDKKVTMLPGVIPAVSNDAEFFPGMEKSWALTFMLNDEDAPTGRPANSLAWAGLANLYYWIDRRTGVGGFWATQILPFADPASVGGYLELETATYDALSAATSV